MTRQSGALGTRPSVIRMEQLIYTWAVHTLTGPGFGVVGQSPGWPVRPEHLQGGLGGQVAYLSQGSSSEILRGIPAPEAVVYRVDVQLGTILLVKRYLGLDANGRSGRYMVHALCDPTNSLDPASALTISQSASIARDWPIEARPRTDLPRIDQELPVFPPRLALKSDDERLADYVTGVAGCLLEYIETGRRAVIEADYDLPIARILSLALNLIPSGMLRDVTFSTFDARPESCDSAVVFVSRAFSDCRSLHRDQVMWSLDATDKMRTTRFGKLGRALLHAQTASGDRFPDTVETITQLVNYLRTESLLVRRPEDLDDIEVLTILQSASSSPWLQQPRTMERVVETIAENRPIAPQIAIAMRQGRLSTDQRRDFREHLLGSLANVPSGENSPVSNTVAGQSFLAAGGSLAEMYDAVWTRTLKPRIDQGTLEDSLITDYAFILDRRLNELDGIDLERAAECRPLIRSTGQWNIVRRRAVTRTFDDPQYARAYADEIRDLYNKYPERVVEILKSEMLHRPAASDWGQVLSRLPIQQAEATLSHLTEACDLERGWLLDLARSPQLSRFFAVSILSNYSSRIQDEDGIAFSSPGRMPIPKWVPALGTGLIGLGTGALIGIAMPVWWPGPLAVAVAGIFLLLATLRVQAAVRRKWSGASHGIALFRRARNSIPTRFAPLSKPTLTRSSGVHGPRAGRVKKSLYLGIPALVVIGVFALWLHNISVDPDPTVPDELPGDGQQTRQLATPTVTGNPNTGRSTATSRPGDTVTESAILPAPPNGGTGVSALQTIALRDVRAVDAGLVVGPGRHSIGDTDFPESYLSTGNGEKENYRTYEIRGLCTRLTISFGQASQTLTSSKPITFNIYLDDKIFVSVTSGPTQSAERQTIPLDGVQRVKITDTRTDTSGYGVWGTPTLTCSVNPAPS